MCGLTGYTGKKRPNKMAMKLLASMATTRGVDNCGIYYNGTMIKGWDDSRVKKDRGVKDKEGKPVLTYGDDLSDFRVFAKTNSIDHPEGDVENHNFFIHTRKTTSGSNSLHNAHPFNVDGFVFMHNGTVKNWKQLEKKYFDKDTGATMDSQLMGLLFKRAFETGDFTFLYEYEGAATMIMHDEKNPNTIYVWKGAHKEYVYDGEKWYDPERTLYYTIHNGGMYISSESGMLWAAFEKESEPFACNNLIKIVNGKIVESTYFDRAGFHTQKEEEKKKMEEERMVSYHSRSRNKQRRIGFNNSDKSKTRSSLWADNIKKYRNDTDDSQLKAGAFAKEKLDKKVNGPFRLANIEGVLQFVEGAYRTIIMGEEVLANGNYAIASDGSCMSVTEMSLDENTDNCEFFSFRNGVMLENYQAYRELAALDDKDIGFEHWERYIHPLSVMSYNGMLYSIGKRGFLSEVTGENNLFLFCLFGVSRTKKAYSFSSIANNNIIDYTKRNADLMRILVKHRDPFVFEDTKVSFSTEGITTVVESDNDYDDIFEDNGDDTGELSEEARAQYQADIELEMFSSEIVELVNSFENSIHTFNIGINHIMADFPDHKDMIDFVEQEVKDAFLLSYDLTQQYETKRIIHPTTF